MDRNAIVGTTLLVGAGVGLASAIGAVAVRVDAAYGLLRQGARSDATSAYFLGAPGANTALELAMALFPIALLVCVLVLGTIGRRRLSDSPPGARTSVSDRPAMQQRHAQGDDPGVHLPAVPMIDPQR